MRENQESKGQELDKDFLLFIEKLARETKYNPDTDPVLANFRKKCVIFQKLTSEKTINLTQCLISCKS